MSADGDIGVLAVLSNMGLYFVSFRTGAAVLKMTRVMRSMTEMSRVLDLRTAALSEMTRVIDLITVVS